MRAGVALAMVLAVLLAAAWPAAGQEDAGRHMLWRVSQDGQTEGYLVGSMHVMQEDAYPLDPVFDDAFAEADVVAFEANLDSMQAQAQTLVMRLGIYPSGQTLESELSEETYALLETRAEELGMNLAQMQRLEPWMVSIMMPAEQMKQAGYAQDQGVDKYFFDKAKEAGVPIRVFETTEEQLRFFDGLAPAKQEAYLRHSLEETDRTIENIDTMMRYWKRGNAGALAEMMSGQMRDPFPELYTRLLPERNERWMPQLAEMLGGEARPMIVVGAGHVIGEDGLAQMLEARGYDIEQL